MNANQFAWFYLIKNGNANVEPSYYGGYDVIDNSLPFVEKHWQKDYSAYVLDKIKNVGIDWDKTSSPKSDSFSKFTDTFHDPEYKEFLTGTLVFKDGTKVKFMGETIEVTNVFNMMAMMDETKAAAYELFGEI